MSKPTVIVYGATSYTAKELLLYLDTHTENDQFDVILAGRNEDRLKTAASKMKKQHAIAVCQLDDQADVKKLVAKGNVVINLAGPYMLHNAEALVRECAATGKHYVDLTGEAHWLASSIVPQYHFQATTTGACIVPSCGFDSVPSDLTVYLALKTLQAKYPDASLTKSISYFKVSGSISGGTAETIKLSAQIPRKELKAGEWALVGRGENGPSPRPKLLYEDTHPAVNRPLIGSFFFMFPYNRCIVRRSWALSRLNPETLSSGPTKHTDDEPVHGGGFEYEEAMETGSRVTALLTSGLILLFGILMFGSKLTRTLVSYFLPKAGTGVSPETLRKGHFTVTNISQTTEKGLDVITTCKAKGDPGYLATTWMLAESALGLILPPPKGTELPHLAKVGGVLTTSTALGSVLIERLQQAGKVHWESKLVESKRRA